MKKFVLFLMMLVAGLAAHATVSTPITFQGRSQTQNGQTMGAGAISSIWGTMSTPVQSGSSYTCNNLVIRGDATVTLNGTLIFQESTSLTDVVTGSSFKVTIESSSTSHPYWFYSATVKTGSDATVSGCTTSVSSDRKTLTVTIPSGTTFGKIVVSYATHEPISSSNTVISGVEREYIYYGSPIKPVPTVTYYGTVLTEGTDYTYYINGGDGVGNATVFVDGAGEYAGSITKNYTVRNLAPSDFNSLGNNTYEIASTDDLDRLAMLVNMAENTCSGVTFKQTANIAYAPTTAWNSGGENNFTAIGGYGKPFSGTYDGQDYTISGIRIQKSKNKYQGLFGNISGTVKNVVLANTRIKGDSYTGGIAGVNNGGNIEDCRVESNVSVNNAGETSSNYGGIVGACNYGGTVSRCTFSGEIKVGNTTQGTNTLAGNVGGIVGYLTSATVSNCLVLGATISSQKYIGAIVGNNNGTITANYYHDCLVRNTNKNTESYTNVGVGIFGGNRDQDGARSVHALTLPDGVTAMGETVVINDTTYYAAATTVTLSYSGEVPAGYALVYSVDGTAIEGDSFVMPAADAAVTVTTNAIDYTITLPTALEHGTITCDKATAHVGDTVTLTVTPDEGYCLASLTVMNGDTEVETTAGNNGTYTFEMPAADVAITVLVGLPIDSIHFPDANFRNYLLSQNYGSDGVLTDDEIAGITTISVGSKNIADLTGIEHFTALKKLYCSNNQLTALDVSHNTVLIVLECYSNRLTSLDVSHNTALTHLYCFANQLTSLDVSHNTALTTLYCYGNQLTSLDVSHNTALTTLNCNSNQLPTLDVSHKTAMRDLYCSDNQLTSLDVSHNTALRTLYCDNNQINGEGMEALVASLPTVDVDRFGKFRAIGLDSETEQNVITTTQVATARGKNWKVYGFINDNWQEYDGSEPTAYLPGDFNGDGVVDVSDLNILINIVLDKAPEEPNSDLTGDGSVDVSDVNTLINLILSNE